MHLPFAVETMGGLSESALPLLREIHHSASTHCTGQRSQLTAILLYILLLPQHVLPKLGRSSRAARRRAVPLGARRSQRQTVPREFLAQRQQYERLLAHNRTEIAFAVREIELTAEPSDSDEEDMPVEDGNESEDNDNEENESEWVQQLSDFHPPQCTAEDDTRPLPATASQLPHRSSGSCW